MTAPHRHDMTAAALATAARGWPVFPIAVGDKAPPRGFIDFAAVRPLR